MSKGQNEPEHLQLVMVKPLVKQWTKNKLNICRRGGKSALYYFLSARAIPKQNITN